jgi:uncharacterized protein YbjQ (UPF0145 family)
MAIVSGFSANEIFCLRLKGFKPGEIVIGNSVMSLGIGGSLMALASQLVGGEIENITRQISDGRHQAISRMEQEARQSSANGISGVISGLSSLSGYTEFIAQGTALHNTEATGGFFSTAASGSDLFCHLDTGYRPIRFVMGNIATALGIGRGMKGSLRKLVRGEVKEFSQMYNEVRHEALRRLQREAAHHGANAVIDVKIEFIPCGAGSIELLLTGTASHHELFSAGAVSESHIVTSELTGSEVWSLAQMGYAPLQLVLATSVYSLGVVGNLTSLFISMTKGELPKLTRLVYDARANCLDLLHREAQRLGAKRIIGNRLVIQELAPGLIEIFAVGTAIRRLPGIKTHSTVLPPQALIIDSTALASPTSHPTTTLASRPVSPPSPAVKFISSTMVILGVLIWWAITLWYLSSR